MNDGLLFLHAQVQEIVPKKNDVPSCHQYWDIFPGRKSLAELIVSLLSEGIHWIDFHGSLSIPKWRWSSWTFILRSSPTKNAAGQPSMPRDFHIQRI